MTYKSRQEKTRHASNMTSEDKDKDKGKDKDKDLLGRSPSCHVAPDIKTCFRLSCSTQPQDRTKTSQDGARQGMVNTRKDNTAHHKKRTKTQKTTTKTRLEKTNKTRQDKDKDEVKTVAGKTY